MFKYSIPALCLLGALALGVQAMPETFTPASSSETAQVSGGACGTRNSNVVSLCGWYCNAFGSGSASYYGGSTGAGASGYQNVNKACDCAPNTIYAVTEFIGTCSVTTTATAIDGPPVGLE